MHQSPASAQADQLRPGAHIYTRTFCVHVMITTHIYRANKSSVRGNRRSGETGASLLRRLLPTRLPRTAPRAALSPNIQHSATDGGGRGSHSALPERLSACSWSSRQPCSWSSSQPCSWSSRQLCSWSSRQPCSWSSRQPCSWSSRQPCSWSSLRQRQHTATADPRVEPPAHPHGNYRPPARPDSMVQTRGAPALRTRGAPLPSAPEAHHCTSAPEAHH